MGKEYSQSRSVCSCEQPNKERMIKLNTNENPYPPAPGVAEALKNLDPDRLRLYPDPACTRLVDAIAKQKGLNRSRYLSVLVPMMFSPCVL